MAKRNISELPRTRKEAKASGLTHYFTGISCQKGHIAPRRVSNGACMLCEVEKGRKSRKSNPDLYKKYQQDWKRAARKENPVAYKRYQEYWRRENRASINAYNHNRRTAKRANEGMHSAADIDIIRQSQKDRCGYCRTKLKGRGEVDHIVASSKGGANWARNLQLLCVSCNRSKHAKDAIDFAQSLGMLI